MSIFFLVQFYFFQSFFLELNSFVTLPIQFCFSCVKISRTKQQLDFGVQK